MTARLQKSLLEADLWVDQLFETVFKISNIFIISPYKVEYDEVQGCYTTDQTKWRKTISVIMTLICAIFASISANAVFSQVSLRSPAVIFAIAPDLGDMYLGFTLWYVVWLRKHDVSGLFSLLSLRTTETWRVSKIGTGELKNFGKSLGRPFVPVASSRGNAILPFVLCLIFTVVVNACEYLKLYSMSFRTPDSFMKAMFDSLVRGNVLDQRTGIRRAELTAFETGVTYVYLLFTCYFKICKSFAILLCIAAVIVIYKNALDLIEYVGKETDQLNIIQAFQAFRDFLDAVNQVTGPLFFAIAIVCAPTFHVANLAKILVSWNLESPITWLTIVIYNIVLIGAADITNKTDDFREWILESGEGQFEQQLFGIFVDLTQNPLGLRGMECFTLTYSFMAQMYSAVVTFTIILLQFQTS